MNEAENAVVETKQKVKKTRGKLPGEPTKHGLSNTKTYGIWVGMRQRCYSVHYKGYPDYGGRGITICPRWWKYEFFLADMGERPAGKSIERIDNNGNYDPENCRWATQTEQMQNTRRNIWITIDGETLCEADWARRMGLPMNLIGKRRRYGWTPQESVLTPVQVKPKGKNRKQRIY